MNVFEDIKARLLAVLEGLQKEGVLPRDADFSAIAVEPPRDAAHGDMATNAALVLTKSAGIPPRALAQKIADGLAREDDIASAQVAGAGFVNLTLMPAFWQAQVATIIKSGLDYGHLPKRDEKINVEYVSANPTGPMHIGHARGAVFGDALARLLECAGYDVTREYYNNDAGGQIDILVASVMWWAWKELGEEVGDPPEGFYSSDDVRHQWQQSGDVKRAARKFVEEYGAEYEYGDGRRRGFLELGTRLADTRKPTSKDYVMSIMMKGITDDLNTLGVKHETFSSEQALHDNGLIDATLEALEKKGLIYQGVLEAPKGKPPPPDWEPSEQTLFRATQFGDDIDRPLKKSNGEWTYFAADIAYHWHKYQRGFTQMINVWGADHIGYVKRVQAAVQAITDGKARLDVKICNLVKLQRGNRPVKMSKRAGTFVTLREVVDEVGKDAVRFMMLTRKNDAPLDFDFDLVKQQSRDNPVFYVQYAHARICSVFRMAKEAGIKSQTNAPTTHLRDDAELGLIRRLAAYPRVLASAAEAREPHRMAFYLQDVAAAFHGLWNKGKDNPALRFICEDDAEATQARLALLKATQQVLACGMDVIGIVPQEEMR